MYAFFYTIGCQLQCVCINDCHGTFQDRGRFILLTFSRYKRIWVSSKATVDEGTNLSSSINLKMDVELSSSNADPFAAGKGGVRKEREEA